MDAFLLFVLIYVSAYLAAILPLWLLIGRLGWRFWAAFIFWLVIPGGFLWLAILAVRESLRRAGKSARLALLFLTPITGFGLLVWLRQAEWSDSPPVAGTSIPNGTNNTCASCRRRVSFWDKTWKVGGSEYCTLPRCRKAYQGLRERERKRLRREETARRKLEEESKEQQRRTIEEEKNEAERRRIEEEKKEAERRRIEEENEEAERRRIEEERKERERRRTEKKKKDKKRQQREYEGSLTNIKMATRRGLDFVAVICAPHRICFSFERTKGGRSPNCALSTTEARTLSRELPRLARVKDGTSVEGEQALRIPRQTTSYSLFVLGSPTGANVQMLGPRGGVYDSARFELEEIEPFSKLLLVLCSNAERLDH